MNTAPGETFRLLTIILKRKGQIVRKRKGKQREQKGMEKGREREKRERKTGQEEERRNRKSR